MIPDTSYSLKVSLDGCEMILQGIWGSRQKFFKSTNQSKEITHV